MSAPRILILTDPFGPPAYSPRVRMLGTLLSKRGWEVTIMTELLPDIPYQIAGTTLFQMPYYSAQNKVKNACLWLLDKFTPVRDCLFTRFVLQHIEGKAFDVVLCSSFNIFPLPTAQSIAKRLRIPLMVDLRDISEQWGESNYFAHSIHLLGLEKLLAKWYVSHIIRRRNRVLRAAKAVSTISPWHVETLSAINPNTTLIFNGFDEDTYYPQDVKNDKFIISYVGRLYDFKLRNPELVFAALHELVEENRIDASKVQLLFHTEDKSHNMLRDMAQQYDIQSITHIDGYVPAAEAVRIMHASSICLLLTNKTTEKGPFGIMTTKFFEIMGCEKPLLNIRSDESTLAKVIADTHAGLAGTNVSEVKQFILEKYEEWCQNGFTRQVVKNKGLFTRQYQATQFESILTNLCQPSAS